MVEYKEIDNDSSFEEEFNKQGKIALEHLNNKWKQSDAYKQLQSLPKEERILISPLQQSTFKHASIALYKE